MPTMPAMPSSGVQEGVNQAFSIVKLAGQFKSFLHMFLRDADELKRKHNPAFDKLAQAYQTTLRKDDGQNIGANKEAYYLEHAERPAPGDFYKNNHRKGFTHIFALDEQKVIEYQNGDCGKCPLIMGNHSPIIS